MAGFDRIDRISAEVARELDRILRDEVHDPRLGGTWSILRAEVTRDLRYCKVRISVLEPEKRKDVMAAAQVRRGLHPPRTGQARGTALRAGAAV